MELYYVGEFTFAITWIVLSSELNKKINGGWKFGN